MSPSAQKPTRGDRSKGLLAETQNLESGAESNGWCTFTSLMQAKQHNAVMEPVLWIL